jgi:hypothetical protein
MYYRCLHEDCLEKDCTVEDCESKNEECKTIKCRNKDHTNQYYELCRICALCEENDPKTGKPVLARTVKCDFFPEKLYRHPIKNPDQWTCHTNTDRMQQWIASLRRDDLKQTKCESNYQDIIKDNFTAIGYESREKDFDICVRCLLKYKDQRSFVNIFPKKRDDF